MKNNRPQQRYFELIKDLLAEHGRGLTRDLLNDFEPEFQVLFMNEFGKILPDVHQDVSDAFIRKIIDMMGVCGDLLSLAVMPAGGFAVWLVRKIRNENIKVNAYLDNYKSEGTGDDGIPIRRPAAVAGLPVDAVLIATPSVSAQYAMARQLRDAGFPARKIILSADAALEMKVDGIEVSSLQRAEKAAEEYRQKVESTGERSILFAVPAFPVHYIDVVKALRRKGRQVSLLSLSPDIMYGTKVGDVSNQFDFVHSTNYDYLEFFRILTKIKADALYSADFTLWNYFAVLVRDLWPGKMFLEVYDFSDNAGLPKGPGIKTIESNLGIDSRPVEDASRKILYHSVEGMIYRDSPVLVDRARKVYGFNTRAIHFPPYPEFHEKLKELDGEEHIAFCGHIPNIKSELVYTVLPLAKELASQKIHMHIYNPSDPNCQINEEYIEASLKSPYFHYHKSLPFDMLKQALRQYDWGWLVYDFSKCSRQAYLQNEQTFTSRIMAYLAAGLPMICSQENVYQAEIIRKYDAGIIIGRSDVPRMEKLLASTDSGVLQENVGRMREEWDIHRKIDDLLDFIT